MTKYKKLERKVESLKNRLEIASAYLDSLEQSTTNSQSSVAPFAPYLAISVPSAYWVIKTDDFTDTELDMLKALVRSRIDNLVQEYTEAVVRLQTVEYLLS